MEKGVSDIGLRNKIAALPQQWLEILRHPLNCNARLAAMGRWATWQIASRLRDEPIRVAFIGRASLWARRGETGITGNIYYGLAEYEDMAFVLHLLRPGDLFVDVGANAGSYSVLASGVIGAKTEAFEPISETADRFLANVALNGIEDLVRLQQVGLAAQPGRLRFTTRNDTVNHVAKEDEEAIEITVETLDGLLEDANPTMIKIDVEGFEAEVLLGGRDTLAKPSLLALIVEINDSHSSYGRSSDEIIELLANEGFRPFAYDPSARRLTALDGRNRITGNTIFIRDEERALARVTTAEKIRLRSSSVGSV